MKKIFTITITSTNNDLPIIVGEAANSIARDLAGTGHIIVEGGKKAGPFWMTHIVAELLPTTSC